MMEMNNKKIVLRSSEDAIRIYDDGLCSIHQYTPPYGDMRINEVIDTVYYEKGYRVPYHYSDRGAETLLILKGKVEVTLYGKTCICEADDFINIPAHCPYSLKTLEEGCVIRGVYTDLDMSAKYKDLELMSSNALPLRCQEGFMNNEFDPEHNYIALTDPADTEEVGKDSLPQITAQNRAIYDYAGWAGIRCELKVGRWNLKRVKEIWKFTIDKGYQMQYFKVNRNESLYCVHSGKVKVEAGSEVYFAEKNDLIHIPPYTPFTLTAMAEKTALYDFNVSARLFRMLEMLELAQRDEPEAINDPEWMKSLFDMNDCYLTGFVLT